MSTPTTLDLQHRTTCLCSGGEAPRSLKDLETKSTLVRLDCDLETLGLMGTALSNAVVSTRNAAAFISSTGGYGRFQTTAMPHHISPKRIILRVAPEVPICVALTTSDQTGRQSLVVANEGGDISHQIESADAFDKALMQSIDSIETEWPEPQRAPTDQRIISLSAVRSARKNWGERDTGHHLNDILSDGGCTRHTSLPHIGRNKAWPVLQKVLVSFLSYIIETGVRHVQHVPGHGLIQSALAHHGAVELLQKVIIVRSGKHTMAIDLDQIESIWVTRFGHQSQLEIYGLDGHAIAVFGADPHSDVSRWNDLLASLPPPAYAI